MKNLIPLTPPFMRWYDDIVEAKHNPAKGTLTGIRERVANRYDIYEARFNSNTLERLNGSTALTPKKNILVHCYETPTRPLSRLKAAIRNEQASNVVDSCQYCAVNSVGSFDHYVPTSSHPEFSVLPLNLIPCCPGCNNLKREKWKRGSKRLVINFYTDALPHLRYLFCRIGLQNDVPVGRFYLRNKYGIVPKLYSIIRGHFALLHLLDHYNRMASGEITDIVGSVKGVSKTERAIKKVLVEHARQRQKDFGYNYWKAVLQLSLAQSRPFIRWIIQNRYRYDRGSRVLYEQET